MEVVKALLADQYFQQLDFVTTLVRVGIAMLLGGLLGLERTRKRRAAGLRTYILVCVSSTIVMMTAQFMLGRFGNTDPARLGAQVISGIGFLGAGTIIVTGVKQIRGLTTAAGLWAAA
jgi:putative Mg2+ transporter-C (MgtC) family protein